MSGLAGQPSPIRSHAFCRWPAGCDLGRTSRSWQIDWDRQRSPLMIVEHPPRPSNTPQRSTSFVPPSVTTLYAAGLSDVLENDAEVDPDVALSVLEKLNLLCGPEDDPPMKTLGLSTWTPSSRTIGLYTSCLYSPQQTFTPRTATLKLLVLLKHRRTKMRRYFPTLQTGPAIALTILDDTREMIRNGQYLWFVRMA